MQLGCVPEIGEVNKVCETPPVKTTDRYSKLCEEYIDIFQSIDKLKCVQVKLHIDKTVQLVQGRHRITAERTSRNNWNNRSNIIQEVMKAPTPWASPIAVQSKSKKPNKCVIYVSIREKRTLVSYACAM